MTKSGKPSKPSFGKVRDRTTRLIHIAAAPLGVVTLCRQQEGPKGWGVIKNGIVDCPACLMTAQFCQGHRKFRPRKPEAE